MHHWRALTVAGAGMVAFAGCCNCDDPAAIAAPGGTLVDVSWVTAVPTAPAAEGTTIVAAAGGAEIVHASTVPSATELPSPTELPVVASAAPQVDVTTIAPDTAPPTTLELALAAATSVVAAPAADGAGATVAASTVTATMSVVESAEGCSMGAQDPFVGTIPMKRGDHGDRVLDVQLMLDQLGFGLGRSGLDGNFGPDTEDAFERYQFAGAQAVTGIVCMEDWYAMVDATGFSR